MPWQQVANTARHTASTAPADTESAGTVGPTRFSNQVLRSLLNPAFLRIGGEPFSSREARLQTRALEKPSADIYPYLAAGSPPLLQVSRNLRMPSDFLGGICLEGNCKMNKPPAALGHTLPQAVSQAQAGLKLRATEASLELPIFDCLCLPRAPPHPAQRCFF